MEPILFLISLLINILLSMISYNIIKNKGYEDTICWGYALATGITTFLCLIPGLLVVCLALCKNPKGKE